MKFERSSGILIHPSSLPGKFGIGDLGPAAFAFVDFLKDSGCKLWQILPLGPTGYGDSPYQNFSAFAGNPYLISPDLLLADGIINPDDLVEKLNFSSEFVEFGKVIPWKLNLLEQAFSNRFNNKNIIEEYQKFCLEHLQWLDEYALFMSLKEIYGGVSWMDFPEPLRNRDPKILSESIKKLKDSLERFKFYQFLFFRQWDSIKKYANNLDIKIIGDLPLYVAHDSVDVWANPDLFQLDENGQPKFIAGVPPDYFSPTGQLWGNPIYNWDIHKSRGFGWWSERVKQTLNLVDIIRLDHFRGFAGYWQVPGGNSTAEHGNWIKGPGIQLFKQLSSKLNWDSKIPIIAEDLGVITEDVIKLRESLDVPGMKILQFAFSGPENTFLPHNYSASCVVYTGTHDNNTTRGWFNSASESEKKFSKDYMEVDGRDISWDLIRLAWASVAVFSIAPMQDILDLDSSARMNYPGQIGNNWAWRMSENYKQIGLVERLKKLNKIYGRN